MSTVETNEAIAIDTTVKSNGKNEAIGTTETIEAQDQSLQEWIKEKYALLKEEKNLGVITWLTTLLTTLAIAYLKLIKYVAESGKMAYWNLPVSIIDVSGDNVVYDIIMSVVFAAVMIAFLLIPLFIIKSKLRVRYKVLWNVIVAVVISLIMFFSGNTKEIVLNNGWVGALAFITIDALFLVVFFGPSVLVWLSTWSPKTRKAFTKKEIAIIALVVLIFNIIYFYGEGYWSSKNQTRYRVTNDGYAIIYETDDTYYLAKYDAERRIIDAAVQKTISSTDVEYTWTDIDE